jgi:hypothetical protein
LNTQGYFTDYEGVSYDATFSSSGIVSDNSTAITGRFSHNAEGDALGSGPIKWLA